MHWLAYIMWTKTSIDFHRLSAPPVAAHLPLQENLAGLASITLFSMWRHLAPKTEAWNWGCIDRRKKLTWTFIMHEPVIWSQDLKCISYDCLASSLCCFSTCESTLVPGTRDWVTVKQPGGKRLARTSSARNIVQVQLSKRRVTSISGSQINKL